MENTYVLYNEHNECVIIDPGCYEKQEKEKLKSYIESNNLEVLYLLNTHSHLDHIFGNAFVAKTWGLTPRVHHSDEPVYSSFERSTTAYGIPNVDIPPKPIYDLEEGMEIKIGDEKLDVLFLPGHCPGHVAFIHHESKSIVSGDVLFKRSIGRTDLPGGDMDTLIKSIKEKLFLLPDDYTVYSGHGLPTSIGEEKANNPFLN